MRNPGIPVPPRKPRHGVVRAFFARLASGAGRRRAAPPERRKSGDDIDLAQRVRECGEW